MSRKVNFKTPEIETEITSLSNLSKWIPLLCAGAAAGISIIALKEIKNIRSELVTIKSTKNGNGDLDKRMLMMEEQFKILTDFIKNKESVNKKSEIIKNAVRESENVNIINSDEYEEVEVTDDEVEEINIKSF